MQLQLIKVHDRCVINLRYVVRAWWSDPDRLEVLMEGSKEPFSVSDDAATKLWETILEAAKPYRSEY